MKTILMIIAMSLTAAAASGCMGISDEEANRLAEEEGISRKEFDRRRIEAAIRMEDYIPPIESGGE